MNFVEAANILVPALSGIPVTVFDGTEQSFTEFEKKYCFDKSIQSWLTGQRLEKFFENSSPDYIYELTDELEIKLTVFQIERNWVALGPFVNRTWNEREMRELLASLGLTTTYMVPYKMYWCNLLVVCSSDVLRTATILIENTVGNIPAREVKEICAKKKQYLLKEWEQLEDIESVNRRYHLERKYMDAVCHGRTKSAVELFRKLWQSSVGLRYYTQDIRDSVVGAAIIRTITRKAAERAGLTPVVVDSVSQQYAQQIHLAVRIENRQKLLEKYVSEICILVRQEQKRQYSLYVKQTVQYIDVHISESLAITKLAAVVEITPAYLAKLFHKEVGMTINQYIAKTRCIKAAELLEESDLSVQEISVFVGYLDNNYFSKVFKRYKGVSPLDFRKERR